MADDAAAERAMLLARIGQLEAGIAAAKLLRGKLRGDLSFVITSLGTLEESARSMGRRVIGDVTDLRGRISEEDVDARDLLQALRSVSEKYFTYKNLSTATRNLTQFNDEYFTKYRFYENLRRISLGCIMAMDLNVISHERARNLVERVYLTNTGYWLTYATMAVMLWWSDEREAAERALRRALALDERKSALFFLFCNLKFGRNDAAVKWYAHYLGTVHANDVGEEYQYILNAYLSGSFGSLGPLEREVLGRFDAMYSEISVYDIGYGQKVAEAARRFIETKAHVSDFEFFYLPEYCPQVDDLKGLVNDAERNALVSRDLESLNLAEGTAVDVEGGLEDSIYDLIESMDDEESELYQRIKYNELVVASKGDMTVAQRAYDERYGAGEPVSLGDLLRQWAFTEDDPRILPEVRRFAIGKLAKSIRKGFDAFASAYRARERERYEISLEGWTLECSEDEAALAKESYGEYFDRHQVSNYLKDRYVQIWLLMIGCGIVGLILAASLNPEPLLIVMAALLIVVGAFLLWQQVENVRVSVERKRRKDLEIVERTLDELGRWRRAYREADQGHEGLLEAIALYED